MDFKFNGITAPQGLLAAWDLRFPPYINTGNVGSNKQSTTWRSCDHSEITVTSGETYRITATSGNGMKTLKMTGWESEGAVLSSHVSFGVKTNTIPAIVNGYQTTDDWKYLKLSLLDISSIDVCSLSEDAGFDILMTAPEFLLDDSPRGYKAPSSISREIYDLSGHGNTLIKGCSDRTDTNSPESTRTGLVYGSDDVCIADITLPYTSVIGMSFTLNSTSTQVLIRYGNAALRIEAGQIISEGLAKQCSGAITTGSHVALFSLTGDLILDGVELATEASFREYTDTLLYIGNNYDYNKPIKGSITAVAIYPSVPDTTKLNSVLRASLNFNPLELE